MLKKEIFVVRHGETENNRLKIWSGCSEICNVPLNNTGRVQAMNVAKDLQKYNIEAIFSSKLLRAEELSNVLSCYLNIPYAGWDGLHEVDYGLADGMLIKDVWEKMPDIADKFINMHKENFSIGFPEGETMEQSLQRMLKALREIIEQPYRRVVVTSHAGLMSVLLCHLGMDAPKTPNCSYAKIVYDGEFHLDGGVNIPPICF